MKKIVTVVGARPQFIKMALISKELEKKRIKESVVHTGQHYDKNLSNIFFKELDMLHADYNLGVGSAPRLKQIANMKKAIKRVLSLEKPEMVLVYGDTNSTLAGTLAASEMKINVAHVEAGLRSFNNRMPEELNRVMTDDIAKYYFCPTEAAVKNLKKEGKSKNVYLVGDVMYDSVKKQKLTKKHKHVKKKKYILCTIHRAENTNSKKNLKNIFKALGILNYEIIMPLHPRTRKFIKKYNIEIAPNIKIEEPVSYKKMLDLEQNAILIITDSGGVQKEAFIFNIPCVTLRKETEWIETVKEGLNLIAGTDPERILDSIKKALKIKKRSRPDDFYGDGFAYKRIVDIINKNLKG